MHEIKFVKVFTNIEHYNLKHSIVSVGAFDGVHRGHVSVLQNLKKLASEKGLSSVAITFDEHPQFLYHPKGNFQILTSNNEKIELIKKIGIDALVFLKFDTHLSNMTYSDFIKLVIEKLRAKAILMGYDNRLGKGGDGTFAVVYENRKLLDIDVFQANELDTKDHISSSAIRKSLAVGDIKLVSHLLGYHYSFDGLVVEGNKIGRTIGFPTANLSLLCNEKLMPNFGVYAVNVLFNKHIYRGMLNYGLKPTVGIYAQPIAEVHILNFSGNLYGETIHVILIDKIRSEMKFDSIDTLKRQICEDRANTEKLI